MKRSHLTRIAWLIGVVVVAGLGAGAWYYFRPQGLPEGFAGGNGRIEAVEIDVAAKIAGRISAVFVDEGDFVNPGQKLAKMNTDVLEAQLHEAQAALQQAVIAVDTSQSEVTQRQAEKTAADALVAQREAELGAAEKRFVRSRDLAQKGAAPIAKLDDDRAGFEGAKAAVSAALAQAAASQAAIGRAVSGVISAKAAVDAARATIQRIQADIDDSVLKSPTEGRVQYLVARPSEVVAAGGVVLNMVDLSDVYMTFFLPTEQAGRVAMGAEARIVLDAVPQYVIPATISFVADVAQFTPKTVETADERRKLMFRIKARISPDLLRAYLHQVKTGLPGMAYVRLDAKRDWPPQLQARLPK